MRVLLLGASGLIGSAVLARLVAGGHEATAVARRRGNELPGVHWVELDLARATDVARWQRRISGIDAVVNCAGVLQSGPGDDARGVHVNGIEALYKACEEASVRRIVHLSAIGADREALSEFSSSKKEGEDNLRARDLDWVILRPSVVVGRPAYGGSALLRGLAALPVLLRLPGTGPVQILQLDDLVDTMLFFLSPSAPARVALDVAGPERLELEEIVFEYRRWLRLGPPRRMPAPRWLAALLYKLGDFAALLGWRPPVRSNARKEFLRGAVGDPRPWVRMTGIEPATLSGALAAEPASVQERWFARLYLLKPLVIFVVAAFWIATGVISLGPGWEMGLRYMFEGGLGWMAKPGIIAGAIADIAIGIGVAFRRTAKAALYAALGLSLFYLISGTFILPRLWADPIGPMMKIWPITVLMLVAIAILEDR
ncbi:MAG: SDR family oxidoreductase [Woeseia sp.]